MKTKKTIILLTLCVGALFCLAISAWSQDEVDVDDAGQIEAPAVAAEPTVEAVKPGDVVAPVPVVEPEVAVAEDEVPMPAESGTGASVFVEIKKDNVEIPGASVEPSAVASNKITIALDDVEIRDVVRMFMRISNANIIFDNATSNFDKRVSVNLTDVEWKPALESILDMYKLALIEKTPGSGVFNLETKAEGPEPMRVQSFFLKYAQVANAIPVVTPMLVSGGSVQPFPSRNALVVRSTASNLGEVKQVIDAIDVLREQVFIEAKFLELNDSAIKDLGINWQVLQGFGVSAGSMQAALTETRNWNDSRTDTMSQHDRRANLDSVNARYDINNIQYEENTTTYEETPPGSGIYTPVITVTPTRTVTDTIDKGKALATDVSSAFTKSINDVRTAVLGVDDFRLVLSALKQMNGVQVVSNPKIIVANEEPATIHIGQEERPFISTVTPATTTTGPIVTYNPGDAVQLGVRLTVIPTINTESNITVRIEPELTRFLKDAIAPNGQTYPIIAKKTIKTVFCLESGKTVAIGGLTETQENDVTKKIPLLGDIPLIGRYLFSHTHTEKNQQETIIFVTVGLARPEFVNKEDGLPQDTELTHLKMIKSEIDRRNFRQEMERKREAAESSRETPDKARSNLYK